jgi:hypothetical protein
MKKNTRTKKGFSIGEVLVAMFILLVGIVDAVFLTVRSVDDLGNSRDVVVATLLAQEGVELVRNVRDNNVTEDCSGVRCTAFNSRVGYAFPSGVASSAWCTAGYTLSGANALRCTGSSDGALYLNESSGFYTHDTGINLVNIKGLKRKIHINYGYIGGTGDPSDQYADVTSVVVFGDGEFPSAGDVANIESTCLKSNNCAYAQTRLTSWINYGE